MPASRPARALAAAVLTGLALAGCGGGEAVDDRVAGDTLNVYVSLPLQGPQAQRSQAIVNGVKLALSDADGAVGDLKINVSFLDDSRGRPGRWDAAEAADNARRAAEDSRSIAYIGDFETGATRVTLPITNQASLLHVTPASTGVDLTKSGPGTNPGEPERYYPTGGRTFGRVVPADDVQARAGARWAKRLGAKRVQPVWDGSDYGEGLIADFVSEARRVGLSVRPELKLDPKSGRPRSQSAVRAALAAKPDLVYFGGAMDRNAMGFLAAWAFSLRDADFMATDSALEPALQPRLRRYDQLVERLLATSPVVPAARLPRAERFIAAYRKEFGPVPNPYAAYGYEALAVILDSIRRAGEEGRDRRRLVESFFETRSRRSVLGAYSIDDSGDTTLGKVAAYRFREGRPAFDSVLTVP